MKLLFQNNISPVDSQLPNMNDLRWSIWNDLIDIDEKDLVVFNTFSCNAILVNKAEIKDWRKLDKSYLYILFRLGILVDAKKDEKKEWDILYSKGKEDLSYIDLTVLLTQNCQMRCVYCFEGEKKKSSITTSTINNILSFMQNQIGTCEKLRVTWFGGEPLLAYNKLRDMSVALTNFCKENHIEYSADITTNGLALNQRRCEELIFDLNVKRYIITVDGLDDIQEQRRQKQFFTHSSITPSNCQ